MRRRDERDRLGGTLAPFLRASLRPIAIACLRLRTRPPEPERKVPRLRLRIALSTLIDAFFEYRLRVVAIAPPPHRSLGHEFPSFRRGPRRATRHRRARLSIYFSFC